MPPQPHHDTPRHIVPPEAPPTSPDGPAASVNTAAERDDWRFSPLNAPDLDGAAPVWMGLAECDPLVDEGVIMADRFRLAGVPVDLEIYRGVTHEFIKMGRAIPEALQAHQDAARAQGKARFEQFVEQLSRHLLRGRSLVRDVIEELHPQEQGLNRQLDEAAAAPSDHMDSTPPSEGPTP